ncbi:MAG: ParB/RepB/Spo0J family partition protein, partial [Pseudomonadota bacterium]
MKLDFIDITNLKTSPVNVRKHGTVNGDDLIPSIRAMGVIQPLLVRPNCDGFEVVAGQRRLAACQALAREGELDPIPCAIMEDGDDAKAIEASLAENIQRLPMDEIDQYEAFRVLSKAGQSVEDIADHFGVTPRLVKQRLAIANLYTPILNAYRKQEIEAKEVRLLTMASTKQQKAWFKLFKDDEHPRAWQLKAWLFGGEAISTDAALFDLATYKGVIVSDLFEDERTFADPALFWGHQSRALAEIKLACEDDGWSEVIVLDVGQSWSKWEHEP